MTTYGILRGKWHSSTVDRAMGDLTLQMYVCRSTHPLLWCGLHFFGGVRNPRVQQPLLYYASTDTNPYTARQRCHLDVCNNLCTCVTVTVQAVEVKRRYDEASFAADTKPTATCFCAKAAGAKSPEVTIPTKTACCR